MALTICGNYITWAFIQIDYVFALLVCVRDCIACVQR